MPQKENSSAAPEPRSPVPVTCPVCGRENQIVLGEPPRSCAGCGASLPNLVVSFSVPIENAGQPILRVDIPGHIENLARVSSTTTAPIETGPLTFVTLQTLGLTPEQIDEIAPTLYPGWRDYWAALIAKKAAKRVSDQNTLLDTAREVEKVFASIKGTAWRHLVEYHDGDLGKTTKWLGSVSQVLRDAHQPARSGRPPARQSAQDLIVFLRPLRIACDENDIWWPRTNATRLDRQDGRRRSKEPLGWELAALWVRHMLPERESEHRKILHKV